MKLRSQSPVFGHWAKTTEQFLVAHILDWRLMVAFACEPDPELAYISLRRLGRLIYTSWLVNSLACEPDSRLACLLRKWYGRW